MAKHFHQYYYSTGRGVFLCDCGHRPTIAEWEAFLRPKSQ